MLSINVYLSRFSSVKGRNLKHHLVLNDINRMNLIAWYTYNTQIFNRFLRIIDSFNNVCK